MGLMRKIFLKFNKIRFNLYAQKYESVIHQAAYLQGEYDLLTKAVNEELKLDKNIRTLLDLGCGTGLVGDSITRPLQIIGVDQSKKMLDILKSKKHKYSEIYENSIQEFLYKDKRKFDIICACSVVQFIPPPDLEVILELIKCKLSPNGKFIFTFDISRSASRLNSKGFIEYPIQQISDLCKIYSKIEIKEHLRGRIERRRFVRIGLAKLTI